MTPLAEILRRRIVRSGPISVADYMTECLFHPQHGYYTTQPVFGAAGDFITAPEISQMFGELIGLALAQSWLDQGAPSQICLVELGPGRGTLMQDVLRSTQKVPGFSEATSIHLIEASDQLRKMQRDAIQRRQLTFHSGMDDLPDLPVFLIANEFFDALPIRQFVRDGNGWRERQIGIIDDALAIGLSDRAPLDDLTGRLQDTKDGDVVEVRWPGRQIAGAVASRIADQGGCALIVDYGGWRSLGDTFQALRSHKPEGVLENPGRADLTAHVDFQALSATAGQSATTHYSTQGEYLERLGITARAQDLAQNLSGAALEQHIAGHRRLTHPDEMGNLFKVLALTPKTAPAPPGFAK